MKIRSRWLKSQSANNSTVAQNKEIYRRATQWCNMSPFFYANIMQYLARRRSSQPVQRVHWPFCWLTCIYLAGVMADSMRNAICVATQTSKLPTRVALLYISLFCDRSISLGIEFDGNWGLGSDCYLQNRRIDYCRGVLFILFTAGFHLFWNCSAWNRSATSLNSQG